MSATMMSARGRNYGLWPGFICQCHGRMYIDKDDDKFTAHMASMEEAEFMKKYTENSEGSAYTSFTTMEPGANREGWWEADDVYEQTIQVLRICEWLHPKATGLFIFDNSTNHGKYAADALFLTSGSDNLGIGGKNAPGTEGRPQMRDGYYYKNLDGAPAEKVVQKMHIETGQDKGKFKGTKMVCK